MNLLDLNFNLFLLCFLYFGKGYLQDTFVKTSLDLITLMRLGNWNVRWKDPEYLSK